MRIRWLTGLLMLCLLWTGVAAAESIHPAQAPLETDAGVFRLVCDAAGFAMPQGYHLEGYRRADFNGDGHIDIIAMLRSDSGPQRQLALLLSQGNRYRTTLCAHALPAADAGGLHGDPLAGITATPQGITLHLYGGSDWHYMGNYFFALQGDTFYLSSLTMLRWHDFLREGTYDTFLYGQGTCTTSVATVEDGQYTIDSGTAVTRTYTPVRGPQLADFDYDTFPTDYDGLVYALAHPAPTARATQHATHRATPRPTARPTATPDVLVRCENCGRWMTAQEYASHTCNQPPVQCPRCGQWLTQEEYARHNCAPAMVQCPVCGNWYEEGNVFRNHICTPDLVQCPTCGNWYEAGNVFRNHICTP